MKKTLLTALAIGLILGVGQFAYVRSSTLSPQESLDARDPMMCLNNRNKFVECSTMPPVFDSGSDASVRDLPKKSNKGFPFAYSVQSSQKPPAGLYMDYKLFINLALFVVGIPLCVFLLVRYGNVEVSKKSKKPPPRSKT